MQFIDEGEGARLGGFSAEEVDFDGGACCDEGADGELAYARGAPDENGDAEGGGGGGDEGVGGEDFGVGDHLEEGVTGALRDEALTVRYLS